MAGKAHRIRIRKLREAKKRARKEAQRKQYEAWKAAGVNTKSKRVVLRNRSTKKLCTISHPNGPCGNVGCKRCNPEPYNLMTPMQLANKCGFIE